MNDETGLERRDKTELSTELQKLAQQTRLFAGQGKSQATKEAYRRDFEHFDEWCRVHGLRALPSSPEVAAFYVTALADSDYAVATIERRLVAISQAHKLTGYDSPTSDQRVREVLNGVRRELGTAQVGKRPLLTVEIRRIVLKLDDNELIDVRDRALLLIGFAGGLRRSEIVGLDVDDLEERDKGIVLHLRRSKTDQEAAGQKVAIPFGRHEETCPVLISKRWLEMAGIKDGPVFRSLRKGGEVRDRRLSPKSVNLVVKKLVESIGLNADRYGAHSLRSGMATEAARNGASERAIMRQTRHRSLKTVRKYIHDGGLFRENAAENLGL